MPKVLVPLAQGCEEMEAVTIIDILRRAEIDVVSAGLDGGPVTGSRKTVILPDKSIDEALAEDYDMVVLPGGLPGSDHLRDDSRVQELLKKMANSGKFTAAVCAAPKALAKAGLLDGKKATAFPGLLESLNLDRTQVTGDPVTVDGKVITGRGPGSAQQFALELIEALVGKEKRDDVESRLK